MSIASVKITFVAFCALSVIVGAFEDPISLFGRIRWNYTSYEENLWTRAFKNTSLDQIYLDHSDFIEAINKAYEIKDNFYPKLNTSYDVTKNGPIVDAFLINTYNVPGISSVVLSNVHVADYWSKFSNWTSFNATNMLDVLTDDAIPTLQSSLDTLFNSTNTNVYFDFLKNVSC